MTDFVIDQLEELDSVGLAKLLSLARERNRARDLRATQIPKISRDGALALSYSQQRLWFLAQLDEGSTSYHIPLGLRLRGALDRVAWQRSLDQLFARHEALRSVFVAPQGQPRVELLPADAGLPVTEHDLQGLPRPQTHKRTFVIGKKMIQRGLDLEALRDPSSFRPD